MATPFHSACPGFTVQKLLCPGSSSKTVHVHSGIASVPEVLCTRINLSATELSRKYTDNVRWEINSYPLLSAIELEIINLFS